MAIVKMSKMRLVGLKRDADALMDIVTASRRFEPEPTFRRQGLATEQSEELNARYLTAQARIGFAIDYLAGRSEKALSLNKRRAAEIDTVKVQKVREKVNCGELFDIAASEKELSDVVDELEKLSFEEVALRSESAETQSRLAVLSPYQNFNVKFSAARETSRCLVMLAVNKRTGADLTPLDEVACYELYPLSKTSSAVRLVCLKENKEKAMAALTACGFELCPFSADATATQLIQKLRAKQRELDERDEELTKKAMVYAGYDFKLKLLYDYYSVRLEQNGVAGEVGKTEYTFVMEGWTPEEGAVALAGKIRGALPGVFVDVLGEEEGDTPPTLTKNNGFVSPFEDMTLMYTVPEYHETDPNPVMSVWFFLLFGIMTGDVVYGLLISLVCFLLPRFKKMENGMRNMIKMFFWCGFSSALWGLLYGSFVGLSIPLPNALPFLSYEQDGANYLGWFNPIEKPMILMGISLAVGILQLSCGYIMKFISCLKERKIADALCDGILPVMIMVSIVLLGFDIFAGIFTQGVLSLEGGVLPARTASALNKAGLIMLVATIGLIFFTAGRHSKSVIGYVGGAFNGLYGLINIVSDIFSYFRLFGLGLAGAAIALAFNTLIDMLFFAGGQVVMIIIGVVLAALLHVFNLAIGVLGAYVHDARLQFLEFYGKFLVGEGRLFTPVGQNTKYTVLT